MPVLDCEEEDTLKVSSNPLPAHTVTHACMQALESAYFNLGLTIHVHHLNLTNARLNQCHRAACTLSAPHIPCYAQVA